MPQSRVRVRAFTLLELMVTCIIMAVLTAVAIPSYSALVSSSQQEVGDGILTSIAQIAMASAQANDLTLPTAEGISVAVTNDQGYTALASTLAAPQPSTSDTQVSYDVADTASVIPNAVGLAVLTNGGGCAFVAVVNTATSPTIYSWTTSTATGCSGTAAVTNSVSEGTTTTTS